MSFIRSRGVSAIQGFIMYRMNGDSIRTSVSVRNRTCVRNSEVSVKRGSTVYTSYAHVLGILGGLTAGGSQPWL